MRKTRPILEVLYQYRLVQGWNGGGASAVGGIQGGAKKSQAQEKDGGKCEKDKSLEVLRLHPIYIISRDIVSPM